MLLQYWLAKSHEIFSVSKPSLNYVAFFFSFIHYFFLNLIHSFFFISDFVCTAFRTKRGIVPKMEYRWPKNQAGNVDIAYVIGKVPGQQHAIIGTAICNQGSIALITKQFVGAIQVLAVCEMFVTRIKLNSLAPTSLQ